MTYLADSDVIASWLVGIQRVDANLATLKRQGLAVSTITYLEVFEGIIGGRNPRRNRQVFRTFLRGIRVIVVSRPIAERAAEIRLELRAQRRQVDHHAMDILIAATGIEHGITLVTGNIRDYADIPGLQLYGTQT